MITRAQKYERLAVHARANPLQSRVGYLIAGTFIVLGILDVISTNWALELGAYEANPLMRYLMGVLGPMWVLPKIMLQATVASMIVWCPSKPTIILMALTCCWTLSVVTTNFLIAISLS